MRHVLAFLSKYSLNLSTEEVWCADTSCKSYVKKASKRVGSEAAGRENKKVDKYSNLSENYHFVPVGVETYGAYGPQGKKLVKQIGKKIQDATGEKLSTFYL